MKYRKHWEKINFGVEFLKGFRLMSEKQHVRKQAVIS